MRNAVTTIAAVSLAAFSTVSFAAEAEISSVGNVSNKLQVIVQPDDGADVLRILTRADLNSPWTTNSSSSDPGTNGLLVGYTWASNLLGNSLFVKAEIKPLSSERQLAAHVMSRLAYGPTPYEMGRILGWVTNANGSVTNITYGDGITSGGIGVDAWINEQLNPQAIAEDVTNQFTAIAPIHARFGGPNTVVLTNLGGTGDTNNPGSCNFHDFKAWYAMHCVGARRQTMEVLLYWLENHMVSSWTPARQTFQGSYNGVGGQIANNIPTKMEIEEHLAYRSAMMRTNITFRELLRLQHESQSMTVYLDTNDSLGSGNNVANENYGREIMELYAMGVDSGYDQGDITALSLAWTGWDVRKVALATANNLFSYQANGAGADSVRSNSQGVYKLQFRNSRHGNSNLFLWYNRSSIGTIDNNYPNGGVSNNLTVNGMKRVASRFNGALGGMTPAYNYANKNYGTNTGGVGRYSLFIASTQSGTDAQRTNKVYTIMNHMADLPYTQEYISVKLCRLLVSDNFDIGYDFSDGVVTPEEQLVWNCMQAWETNTPKGQIYKVVKAITDSSLFRSEASYRQKLRDPLEYTMAAVRSLRVASNDVFTAGNFTADSLGYSVVAGTSSSGGNSASYPLNRMGLFLPFDRDTPDGYPEVGPTYVGASGLVERARWINSVMYPTYNVIPDSIDGGNRTRFHIRGVMDRFLSPVGQNDADQVVRLFLRLLFPGEGEANLDGYRRIGLSMLNQTIAGAASPWTGSNAQKDDRVPRMVGALMSMPRFSEQ